MASGRVENTRVNPDSLIDELLAATDLKQAVEDSAESEYYEYTILSFVSQTGRLITQVPRRPYNHI